MNREQTITRHGVKQFTLHSCLGGAVGGSVGAALGFGVDVCSSFANYLQHVQQDPAFVMPSIFDSYTAWGLGFGLVAGIAREAIWRHHHLYETEFDHQTAQQTHERRMKEALAGVRIAQSSSSSSSSSTPPVRTRPSLELALSDQLKYLGVNSLINVGGYGLVGGFLGFVGSAGYTMYDVLTRIEILRDPGMQTEADLLGATLLSGTLLGLSAGVLVGGVRTALDYMRDIKSGAIQERYF